MRLRLGIDTTVNKAHDSIMNSVEGQLGFYGIDPFRMDDDESYDLYTEMSSKLWDLLDRMAEEP